MGCCASLPKADDFLVAQNVPPENRLMPAPETFRMSGWSIASSYTDYEKQGPMSLFHDNKHKGPDTGVVRKDGPADVLTISDVNGGATIATLQMPPHQSFGARAPHRACVLDVADERLHAACTQGSLPR